ncbi:MAG: phosphatase PAP2 family protein [Novosphingobium sp.]|nr:phosphatase PAP2 family protein [Novosphingobium sp.]MCP5403135.1 phosphatase PAP2 family protein [Novosphingobium sp.]
MPLCSDMDTIPTGPPRIRLISVALACWAGFVLVAWWQASGASADFDRAGLLMWRQGPMLQPIGPGWLSDAFDTVTQLGGGRFRTALGLLALVLLFACGHRYESLLLAAILLPAAAINSVLKLIFARPRPDLAPYLADFGGFSFPSGHSFNGAATYIGLALILVRLAPNHRIAMLAMATALSLAIAFSRVWLGVHYPTDAIAGWLGGAGWALVVASLPNGRTGSNG